MTREQRNQKIKAMIERKTQTDTASPETARRALISEGIYTEDGRLAPEYDG